MTGRIHRFEALENFRDYGDYGTAAGRRVSRGRLFRSAHQARVSEADLERLSRLGISTVVDLRRPGERREQPSRRPPGWAGQIIESDHDDGGEAPHITFLKTSDLTVESARGFMSGVYRQLAFEPPHLDLFARYFRVLADAEGAVLIHCAAGKDRTGLLAALTHHLLDVHRDDMLADYLLTNTAVDLAARAPAIARQLETFTGRSASHEAVVAFLGVEAAWLEAALDEVAARYGSVDAYLERALGVDARLRDRIGERLSA
ncbi:tyrosine-protein phosphatase [Brevundimonas viscosa]|uniref:Protein tyrosine/serine phosphatase n=1 Tax=Brevundimonas viscosa TaxID=871741 RepID=A0A1I6PCY8_9CAUL|nr:tyrosine-protein phosphatase [Brevundimonas viscosa]SFS38033.1 Protein tyrosine/serine phosphatase [Brevundimonas viscosa]